MIKLDKSLALSVSLGIAAVLGSTNGAHSQSANAPEDVQSSKIEPLCIEAKNLIKVINVFGNASPKRVNQARPEFSILLTAIDDAPEPERIYYIHKDKEIDLVRDSEGEITNLDDLKGAHKSGEICMTDPTGVHTAKDDKNTMSVNGNMSFYFDNTSGIHDVSDLIDGTKDMSKLMSKLAPPGLGFVVPSLNYIKFVDIGLDEEATSALTVRFIRNGSELDTLVVQEIKGQRYVSIKALKKAKASQVAISGGTYKLEAAFDPT